MVSPPLPGDAALEPQHNFAQHVPAPYHLRIPRIEKGQPQVKTRFFFGAAGSDHATKVIVHTGDKSQSFPNTSRSIRFSLPAETGLVQHWQWFMSGYPRVLDILVEIVPGMKVWLVEQSYYGFTISSDDFPYYRDSAAGHPYDSRPDDEVCGDKSNQSRCDPRPKIRFAGPIAPGTVFVEQDMDSSEEPREIRLKNGELSGEMVLPNARGHQAYPQIKIAGKNYTLVQRKFTLWTIHINPDGTPRVVVEEVD